MMAAAVATACYPIPIICRTTPSFVGTVCVVSNKYNVKTDTIIPVKRFLFIDSSTDGLTY
jgi:hypothetical protein